MSRHLPRIVLCVGLLANAGCSNERQLPTHPSPPIDPNSSAGPTEPPPPQPSPAQRLAALALLEAARAHQAVTASPFVFTTEYGKVWTNGPCAELTGSLQGSLDGVLPPTSGTLPTGSHTYVVSFSNCLVGFFDGTELNGVVSAAYRTSDWNNITATVSADSVRGHGELLLLLSRLDDVTADGSAVWTSVGSPWVTTTYTPAAGSRLVNNSTTNVATFGGGSYSEIQSSGRSEWRFDSLNVAINGTQYILNGSLDFTFGFRGSITYTGEIRIISNGTLVARIYGDVSNTLAIEVLVPLASL